MLLLSLLLLSLMLLLFLLLSLLILVKVVAVLMYPWFEGAVVECVAPGVCVCVGDRDCDG